MAMMCVVVGHDFKYPLMMQILIKKEGKTVKEELKTYYPIDLWHAAVAAILDIGLLIA